jgi:hypothetical protein
VTTVTDVSNLHASAATSAAQTTAQNDLDLLTGSDGATLATSQPNYAPATATALTTHDGKLDIVDTNVDTLLVRITSTIFSGITSLAEWLGMIAGKQTGDATALTEIKATGAGSGTFDPITDAVEAIRDRGDTSWTTGAGGSDRLLMVDTTIATLASQTSFTLTAGSADDDAYNNCTIVIEDVTTSTQKAVGIISDYVGSTLTVTLKYDPAIFTMAATDKVYILAENALKATLANRQLDVTSNGNAGIDWGNIENPTTVLDLAGTDINLVDTTTTNSDMRGTESAALASAYTATRAGYIDNVNNIALQTTTAQTGDSFSRIGAAGASLTDLGGMSTAMQAEVNAEVLDVLQTDTFAELASIPGATSSLKDKLTFLFMLARNQLEQTATASTLRADDTTTSVGASTVADDGTTATKGEWA